MLVNVRRQKVTEYVQTMDSSSKLWEVLAGDSNVVSLTLTYKNGGVVTYTHQHRANSLQQEANDGN